MCKVLHILSLDLKLLFTYLVSETVCVRVCVFVHASTRSVSFAVFEGGTIAYCNTTTELLFLTCERLFCGKDQSRKCSIFGFVKILRVFHCCVSTLVADVRG